MGQPLSNSEWYDQSLPEDSGSPPAAPRPGKNRRPGLVVASAVVGVLMLIVLSVYAFSDRSGPESTRGEPPRPSSSEIEDFKEYFEWYYSAEQSDQSHDSRIRRTAAAAPPELSLTPSDGLPELTLGELYRNALPSLVGIRAYADGAGGHFWGSGVVLTADGYILTNQHLVAQRDSATVLLHDGREAEALLVGEDYETDLAILKVELKNLVPAVLGDSSQLAPGDRVAAIGHPMGDELTGTLTDGIVSGAERSVDMGSRRMRLIQTNAAINEGNSGGPVLNMYGQVIGIVNMKLVSNTLGESIEGLGFAIPTTVIREVGNQLLAAGKVSGRPTLGVTLAPIPSQARERYGLPAGLYVISVSEGSDAMEKDVRPGDILTQVNGTAVTTTEQVLKLRDALSVGDSMTLRLWREGKVFETEIVLRDRNEIK